MLKIQNFLCRIRRRKFYLKLPFESITEEHLPEVTEGYKKKVCQNEKYHVGRVAEIMAFRQNNNAETKVFTIGSNIHGQDTKIIFEKKICKIEN